MKVSSIGRLGLLAALMTTALVPPATATSTAPQVMKLLVIGVDGTEPTYAAIQAFLDETGIPYDSFLSVCRVKSPACALPVFNTTAQANYYGVILTVGDLACPAGVTCPTANLGETFSPADWTALNTFTSTYGIRTLVLYDFPEARYGLTYAGTAVSTTSAAPVNLTLAKGQTVFPYIKSTASIPVENAYMYMATTTAATGETTTPVLSATYGGKTYTAAALHTSSTGQYLTLTMDQAYFLEHSLVLSYGLLNWVTKGMFLGAKKYYLSPEVDDLFIADDLYDAAIAGCVPSTFLLDPTSDPSLNCPTVRINGNDITALYEWQANINKTVQGTQYRTTLAFNGLGAMPASAGGDQPANDTLVPAVEKYAPYFWFVSHTYDHENLDCYDAVLNSGVCPEATAPQANLEIEDNVATATSLKLGASFDSASMVTPEVSGLANAAFISTAYADGLRYLVSDASKAGQGVTTTNVGIPNALNANILEIPRFATNIFYNVDSPTVGAVGSEPDEYNHFYGPSGVTKQADGQPWFTTTQTEADVINTESNNLLINMLKGYAFPSMFHQSNLRAYSKGASLFTDTIGNTIIKFEALINLPFTSQSESQIGALLWERMKYNASEPVAMWTPGASGKSGTISLSRTNPAVITMTGADCPNPLPTNVTCETYGGQTLVHVDMTATPTFTLVSPE
jgi:hypothetical protein